MSKRDYYEVLGVDRSAGDDDIRRSYRRLARQYHPDVNKSADAETRFKEVNEAYEVLSDHKKRTAYDQFGHVGPQAGFGQGFTGFGGFGDIFEDLFGFGARTQQAARRGPLRGADLRYNLTISFEEAIFGCTKELEIPRLETCPACGGEGAEPGTTPVRCPQCNGAGEVRQSRQSIFGSIITSSTCPRCRGEGEVTPSPCRECGGQKRTQVTKTILVDIPAGVDDGTQIRLAGEGEAGINGGPAGNLYVVLSVTPHDFLHRRDNDVLLDLEINMVQAALGDEVEVPTLDGTEKLRIPAGTQTGRSFRMRGKGVPHLRRKGRGDLVVTVFVRTPTDLTKEQTTLLQDLARTLGKEVVPTHEKGLFDRLREAFKA
ncbi:MAG: molecular chaperone DnaJ [Chloroflexi bacterium]|nr:molecular chaperone DnaJ [Chloroflexota bacterium]